jgi:hypothetical protein
MKTLGYIGGAVLVIFGVLFLLGAGDPARGGGIGWIITGAILLAAGLALFWFVSRKPKPAQDVNVTYKVDLSGDVNLETMKCRNCGGQLSPDNVKMVNGAPMVTCPYCGTVYQLTEEPKW